MTNPWNAVFKGGRFFHEPHPDVLALAQRLREQNATTVLDLGCGTGRHTVYLAQQGFEVYGLDSAAEGIDQTTAWLQQVGLTADLRLQDMTEPLPYAGDSFDAVLSVQVIHHGRLETIQAVVAEIDRVTRPGGLVFVTVPRDRNQATQFAEIAPNTLVPLDGIEKGLPHYYFTPDTLAELFRAFQVEDIHLDAVTHYCLTAVKP
jgi:2-polyprenyl-3-methyl-5-hydroxy-6-metoxy-1,4-benzoquinol methylase